MKYRKVHFKHKKIKKLANYKDGWTLEQELPEETVESHSLEILKPQMDKVLSKLL